MNYNDIALSIIKGEHDEMLDTLIQVCQNRKKDLAPKIWEFKVGDGVRLVNAHPKYLNGALAEVVKVNRAKVVIRLYETASARFTKFTAITVPLTMIEKVN